MALVPISPFCFGEFDKRQGRFVDWLVNYIEKNPIHGRSGWLQHLQSYDYSRPGHETDIQPAWQKGANSRANFSKRLRASLLGSDQALIGVVNAIDLPPVTIPLVKLVSPAF